MKRLLASCSIAFSTYSRIPVPQVEWNEKNMRHTLAFLPLVGAAVGLAFWLTALLCSFLGFGGVLRAALLTAVPVVITGGIHLDGFCDTIDALSSHAPREKKLAILKDSNSGAFAVIWCGVWYLVYFGLLTEASNVVNLAAGFVLSRALSAFAVDRLPSAREGMGATLKKGSKFPLWMLIVYVLLSGAAVVLWGNRLAGAVSLAAALAWLGLYCHLAKKIFGGFTGDLAGWFLQICELVILAAGVITERVCAL